MTSVCWIQENREVVDIVNGIRRILEALTPLLPLLGVVIGMFGNGWITRSNARKQWLNDCCKEEYKELMKVITEAHELFIMNTRAKAFGLPSTFSEVNVALACVRKTLQDRIYIADDLKSKNITNRWTEATDSLNEDKDEGSFVMTCDEIRDDIIALAMKD